MKYQLIYNDMLKGLSAKKEALINSDDFYTRDELLPGFLDTHNWFKSVLEEVKCLNDNTFLWSAKLSNGTETLPMGEFHFLSIEELMKHPLQNTIGNSLQGEFYPFDEHPVAGDGIMSCMYFVNNQIELWLHTENGELIKLNMNLNEYLTQSFKFKAMYGWQYLFTDMKLESPAYSVVRSDLNYRLKILNAIFPEMEYHRFILK